jgi:hypothetical protein
MDNMLSFCGMDCKSYDQTLTGWNANPSTPNSRNLGAKGRKYWNSVTDRDNLINNKAWTITGDVLFNCYCTLPAFTACPTPITTNTQGNLCLSAVMYTATASGNPAPTYSYTFTGATTDSGSGTGSGANFNQGITTVTVTATNTCGAPTCMFTVTVADNIPPTVVCKPFTAALNAQGIASVATADVYASGSDNCGTINQVSVSPNTFTCNNFGPNNVTLTVNDGNGNTATCQTTVTVDKTTAPKPAVNAISNQVICAQGATSAVSFTSPTPGALFKWTNSTPSIGLSGSGQGNIPSFMPTGSGVGVVVVTPEVNGCIGVPGSFLIVVF